MTEPSTPFGVTIFNGERHTKVVHTVRRATDLNRAICECVARLGSETKAGGGE
jgi:hypothetical protein